MVLRKVNECIIQIGWRVQVFSYFTRGTRCEIPFGRNFGSILLLFLSNVIYATDVFNGLFGLLYSIEHLFFFLVLRNKFLGLYFALMAAIRFVQITSLGSGTGMLHLAQDSSHARCPCMGPYVQHLAGVSQPYSGGVTFPSSIGAEERVVMHRASYSSFLPDVQI